MINTLSAGKDNFYRQMLKLTIPIIIQNLLSAAVNSADVIMLNYVGQSAISAVSLAANYSNILFMVYYGLGTGASLLCAQYFGKNNMQAIHAIEGIALRFSIIISGIVAYYPECHFYLRAFRRTEAGGYRCCHCNCCFQTDRTGSMRDRFFPEQRC